MPRPTRAETRARVLEAAAAEFARRGVDATSLEAIAVAAGLSKGAIYSNFESKEELVFAVADAFRADIDHSMFLDVALPFDEQLREFGRATARTLRGAHRRQVQLDRAIQAYVVRHPTARTRHRRHLSAMVDVGGAWLEALAVERSVDLPIPGAQFVHVLNALARGLIEAALLDPSLLDEEFFADAFALLAPSLRTG